MVPLSISGLDAAGFLAGLGLMAVADRLGYYHLALAWSRDWPQLAMASRPVDELVSLVVEDAQTYRPRWMEAPRTGDLSEYPVSDTDYSDEHDAALLYSSDADRKTTLAMGIGHQDLLVAGRKLRDVVTEQVIRDAIDGPGGRPVLSVPPSHCSLRLSTHEEPSHAYRWANTASSPVPISVGQQWLAWRGISAMPDILFGRRIPHVLWRQPTRLRTAITYLRRWYATRPWQDRGREDWWATPDGQASRAQWRRAMPSVSLYESIITRTPRGQGSVSPAGCVIP